MKRVELISRSAWNASHHSTELMSVGVPGGRWPPWRTRSVPCMVRMKGTSKRSARVSDAHPTRQSCPWTTSGRHPSRSRSNRVASLTIAWFAEAIDAIGNGRRPELDDPEQAIAYEVARELVHERGLSEATLEKAKEILGERALVEVVTQVGFYQLVSGLLESFQPPPPSGDLEVTGPPTTGLAS